MRSTLTRVHTSSHAACFSIQSCLTPHEKWFFILWSNSPECSLSFFFFHSLLEFPSIPWISRFIRPSIRYIRTGLIHPTLRVPTPLEPSAKHNQLFRPAPPTTVTSLGAHSLSITPHRLCTTLPIRQWRPANAVTSISTMTTNSKSTSAYPSGIGYAAPAIWIFQSEVNLSDTMCEANGIPTASGAMSTSVPLMS